MSSLTQCWQGQRPIWADLHGTYSFFLRPARVFRSYRRSNLRIDVLAGLTVAVILLPQAIVFTLIAELPPQTGLYTAIVAAIVGVLWGSSNHLQTCPTNTGSLLVLSVLLTAAIPGTPEFIVLAGLVAVDAVRAAELDTRQILTCNEMISSKDIFIAVTGITDDAVLSGVRYRGRSAETDSLVRRCETSSRRLIHTEHFFE
jgi:hypothetical protein